MKIKEKATICGNIMQQWNKIITRKFFLPVILNLIQIFIGIRQKRTKPKFKILAAEFKRESNKFILNSCTGFTEMTLYFLLAIVYKEHW